MSANPRPNPDRYQDNPFLLLLDCYILDVIGQLPAQQREALEKLEPTLQETFGATGQWRELVEEQMGFLPSITLDIEMVWVGYQERVKQLGGEIVAGQFVREFVAQNFPSLTQDDSDEGETPA